MNGTSLSSKVRTKWDGNWTIMIIDNWVLEEYLFLVLPTKMPYLIYHNRHSITVTSLIPYKLLLLSKIIKWMKLIAKYSTVLMGQIYDYSHYHYLLILSLLIYPTTALPSHRKLALFHYNNSLLIDTNK
jgi:hypothetical protein